jgi:predicted RND superfamily exporter protein
MKKNLIIIIILLLTFSACGPTPKEAAEYNTKLALYHNQVVNQINVLEESFKNFDTVKINIEIEKTKELTAKNYKKILKIGALDGDSSLYRADSVYFKRCFELLSNEYKMMYNLYRLPDEEYGEEGEFKFKKLQFEKDRKFTQVYEQYLDAQEKFALKYSLVLKDN